MIEVSKRISDALNIRNMKPIDLSEKTGIPKSSISHYMSGEAKPKQDRIYLIAKALCVQEAWLMGYDVPMEEEKDDGDVLADVFTDPELMDHVEKLNKLSAANKQIVYNMIDALMKGE
ncbi:MAG: helix-turn-helix domain-containing protein [Clostridia bacterium]|nr:helix-turn-helix domain-containing protein [Clostridia bacterium]